MGSDTKRKMRTENAHTDLMKSNCARGREGVRDRQTETHAEADLPTFDTQYKNLKFIGF